MKVAFVFPPMWTPHSDGSLQIWNHEVTTRLAKYCDVLVYAGHPGLTPVGSHDSVEGVRYRHFSVRLDNRFLKRFQHIHKALGVHRPLFSTDLWYPFYAWKVALDLRKQRCDVVHVYNYPQIANLIKYFNPGVRVILNMHGELLTQIKFSNINERLRNIDLVISCSKFITNSNCTVFPQIANRFETVPMGLSPDAFSGCFHNVHPDNPSARRILCVGRISPEKGVHVLLDAFELIVRKYPDASLTIVGPEWVAPRGDIVDLCLEKEVADGLAPFYEGSYLSQLKQRVSPEAAKRVTFAGLVAHSDVPSFYGNADIYVSPSLYESFGMSVIEAMAAGLPVVAARVKSFEDLISDGRTGLLVEAANPSAIADAVIKLFENDSLRNSIASVAREMVCRLYSWETICITLMRMYREVLDTGAAPIAWEQSAGDLAVKSPPAGRGGEIPLDRALAAEAVKTLPRSSSEGPHLEKTALSDAQTEILQLILQGYRNKEIGEKLVLSEQTVENHLHTVFDKLGVSDRLELALYAIDHRLCDASSVPQLVRFH